MDLLNEVKNNDQVPRQTRLGRNKQQILEK
jgi:hypothetical protein